MLKQVTEFVYRLRQGIKVSNRSYEYLVSLANQQAPALKEVTDSQLQQRFVEIGHVDAPKRPAKSDIVAAVAIVREAAQRTPVSYTHLTLPTKA